MRNNFSDDVNENIRLNSNEAAKCFEKLESYPVKLYIEPTQKCNINCITCGAERRKLKSDMPMDLFYRLEKELFHKVAEVDFFLTGEPFLCSHFTEMIAVSKKYTFLPKVFTNGVYLPDDVASSLVESGVFVNFSFDAADAPAFEAIRKGAKFDTVVSNIKKLQRLIAAKRYDNCRPAHLRLACTLALHNIDQAERIVEFAHDNDIKDLMFGSYDGPYNPTDMLFADPSNAMRNIDMAMRLADKYKIRVSFPKRIGKYTIKRNNNWLDFHLPIDEYAPFLLEAFNPYGGDCFYPWTHAIVRVNGDVVSCCQRQHVMGNIDKSSFLSIWNGEKYQRLRQQKNFYHCMGVTCNMAVYSIWVAAVPRMGKGRNFSLVMTAKEIMIRFLRFLNFKVPVILCKLFK